jgi:hypothetical protein
MRLLASGWTKAFAGALVAGSIVAAQGTDPTIHACVQNSTGTIVILSDPTGYTRSGMSNCGSFGSGTHVLDFNQQGVAGTPGTPGARGASESVLFARVGAGGGVQSGSPGVGATLVRKGLYQVSFPGNQTDCAPVITPIVRLRLAHDASVSTVPWIDATSISYNGSITTIGFPELDASSKDAGGVQISPTDNPFVIRLICPPR